MTEKTQRRYVLENKEHGVDMEGNHRFPRAARVPACGCGRAAYALAGGVGGEAARTHGGREGEAPRAWPEEGATRAPLNGGAT